MSSILKIPERLHKVDWTASIEVVVNDKLSYAAIVTVTKNKGYTIYYILYNEMPEAVQPPA